MLDLLRAEGWAQIRWRLAEYAGYIAADEGKRSGTRHVVMLG